MSEALAASRRTFAGFVATSVASVAGSPGHPVPGGTGEGKSPPVTGWTSMGFTVGPGRAKMRPMVAVTVLGGGVIGLTSALELARAGHAVTVVRERPALESVSGVAGGLWFPYHVDPPARVLGWGLTSLRRFEDLALDESTGVRLVEGLLVERRPTDRWWTAGLEGRWREAAAEELPVGAISGVVARFPLVDGRRFLPWLEAECSTAGVRFEDRVVASLTELAGELLVLAAGLGAARLLGDTELVGSVGQVVHLADPGLQRWLVDDDHPDGMVYTLPHGDRVVCGGTDRPAAPGEADPPQPDAAVEAAILERCRSAVPTLAQAPVLSRAIGLRPVAPAVRLARHTLQGRVVVTNYGHGGAGVTLSWGCAEEVVTLVGR